ncbi:TlpA disulfide reductase family protein [Chitinophaga sp. YIM B06452]|uniref:TlpA disulfide reductase family protein n=1 Tax=Chitinophaga sp. YIM B06452 TaxID=3082158 RepID=UPI0031FEDDF1
MRTVSILFSLLAAAFVANAQFRVSGSIAPAQEGQKLYFVSEDGNTRDSSVLKDGKFSFQTAYKPAKDDMFALLLEGQQYPMLLVAENNEVEIQGDAAGFPVAKTVKAGQQTQWMQAYHKAMEPVLKKVQELNTEAATINSDDEAAKAAFRAKATDFETQLMNTGMSFVKDHPKAQASLFLLYGELKDRLTEDEFSKQFGSLDASVRNTKFGKSIAEEISAVKAEKADAGMAKDFEQKDPKGKLVKLSSFRGKYVLIDFWASWCGPCRQENPNVVAAYHKFKDKNFTILGVSLDKNKASWLEAIEQDRLEWTQVSDLQGWANAVAQLYRVQGIPQNFLVDPQGKIIASNLRGRALEKKLEEVLR